MLMYSILREAFIYKPESWLSKELSIEGKVVMYIQLIILAIIPSYVGVYIGFTILIMLFALTRLLRGFVKLLKLLSILVTVALLFQLISFIMYGYEITLHRIFEAFTNNLRLVVLAGSTSLFFSITSTRELRWLSSILGLKEIGYIIQLTVIVVAYMLFLADNAYFIFSLKRGSRELITKFLKPMLFSSIVAARQVAEYTAFYGVPKTPRYIRRGCKIADFTVNTIIFIFLILAIFS